jgi:hypothetical protein
MSLTQMYLKNRLEWLEFITKNKKKKNIKAKKQT